MFSTVKVVLYCEGDTISTFKGVQYFGGYHISTDGDTINTIEGYLQYGREYSVL